MDDKAAEYVIYEATCYAAETDDLVWYVLDALFLDEWELANGPV
jgi:hypothetical protein